MSARVHPFLRRPMSAVEVKAFAAERLSIRPRPLTTFEQAFYAWVRMRARFYIATGIPLPEVLWAVVVVVASLVLLVRW